MRLGRCGAICAGAATSTMEDTVKMVCTTTKSALELKPLCIRIGKATASAAPASSGDVCSAFASLHRS